MFILNTTNDKNADGDPVSPIDRLARLMVNIERGTRAYDWDVESTATPHQKPKPGFLSIAIPSVTKNSPSRSAEYRPAVGFIYYVPSAELDIANFAIAIAAALRLLPSDHLEGYFPVEVGLLETLLHKNRTFKATHITHGDVPKWPKEWKREKKYPSRVVHVVRQIFSNEKVPSHASRTGGFTWYVIPAGIAAYITCIESFKQFNAIVASVFYNTRTDPQESETPTMVLTPELFGVEPFPARVKRVFEKIRGETTCESKLVSLVIIFVGDHFEFVGKSMRGELRSWKAPPNATTDATDASAIKLSNRVFCFVCGFPLWGDFYAVLDKIISPFKAGTCEWCCGSMGARYRSSAIHVRNNLTAEQAYSAHVEFKDLAFLASARVTHYKKTKPHIFIVSEAAKEGVAEISWFLRNASPNPKHSAPALFRPGFENTPYASVTYGQIVVAKN